MPGSLILETTDGRHDEVSAADLAQLLRPKRERLKLVTVAACHSGAESLTAMLTSLGIETAVPRALPATKPAAAPQSAIARTLTAELDCAVVAMRFAVEDAFAIALAGHLYRQLMENRTELPQALRLAVTEAAVNAGALSRATTTVFGARAVGLALVPPRSGARVAPLSETMIFEVPDEHAEFVGRVAVMTRASAALATASNKGGVLFHGMAGGLPGYCTPNSIWLDKCRSDVLTVGTCDLEKQMWDYSSRGAGPPLGGAGDRRAHHPR